MAEPNETTTGAMTRREAREAFQTRTGSTPTQRRSLPNPAAQASVAPTSKSRRKIKGFANLFVLVAAAGVVGTIAIPAYAFNPSTQSHADSSSAVIDTMTKANAQSANVSSSAVAPAAAHESFDATSIASIQSVRQAQEAQKEAAARAAANAAAAKAAAKKAAAYTAAYSGPTAAQYAAQAPDASQAPAAGTSYSLANVLAKAETYAGTPYVYGGATPAGFDCSGFVMFVYAQFGVSLPHSSTQQGQIGQTVSLAQAQPGDVIALNDGSHVGFYAGKDASGNVLIYDAPKPGGSVGERPIWTSAYHIQHYGG